MNKIQWYICMKMSQYNPLFYVLRNTKYMGWGPWEWDPKFSSHQGRQSFYCARQAFLPACSPRQAIQVVIRNLLVRATDMQSVCVKGSLQSTEPFHRASHGHWLRQESHDNSGQPCPVNSQSASCESKVPGQGRPWPGAEPGLLTLSHSLLVGLQRP